MANFRYDSRDASGRANSGTIEAVDARGVASLLAEQGLIPLRIVETDAPATGRKPSTVKDSIGSRANLATDTPGFSLDTLTAFLPAALRPKPRRRVSDVELQLMTRELQAMLKAGVPIMRSLALLKESSANPAMADALGRIANDLDSGLDLATAMDREADRSRLFAPYYVSLVRVAEATGRLDQGLLSLSKHLQFLRETREQVNAALRYPIFVLIATFAAIVIVNLFVLPQFERVFKGMNARLPVLTDLLLTSSRLFVVGWPILLILGLGLSLAYRVWTESAAGSEWRDRWLLKLPIVGGIVRRTSLSRFAVSLATALRSGVPVAQALTIVSETVGNRIYAIAIEGMRARVERGESLRAASAISGMFPPVLQQVISVGEETGALEELLAEIGSHYQSEVEYEISKLSARIEPILIVMLGAIVLVLALGVFMPMWEMGRASLGRS